MAGAAFDKVLTKRAVDEKVPDCGVFVIESHHAPGFVMEWRTHSFVKLVYALTGSGDVEIRKEKYGFQPRDVIVVPPGHRNRIIDTPGTPTSLYVFCLSTELLQFDAATLSRLRPGSLRRDRQFANQVERRLRRLLYIQDAEHDQTPLKMVSGAMQLLEVVLAQPIVSADFDATGSDADPDRGEVLAYVEYLNTHFFEARTIDEAARRVGIERRRFTQLFREITGLTWLRYVRQLGINHAKHLLLTTSLPVTSVAFECGFEDLSTFYRHFKSANGESPVEWRTKNRTG